MKKYYKIESQYPIKSQYPVVDWRMSTHHTVKCVVL